MKILHFSDTHLGFNIDNSKRDDDFYNSFNNVIDYAINNGVKYVLHSGDLFHFSKPWNKAISVCVDWLLKLSEHGIKTIMIAWNHSTPRLTNQTHAFEIFKEIPNVFLIYKDLTDAVEFDDLNLVWLPHIHSEKVFKEELSKAWDFLKSGKLNIYMSHFWITAQEYDEYTDEISWINILKEDLENLKKYDYVAMWHYHKNFKIWNIHYSGSLEHTSFNQKWNKTWFNILTIKDNKLEKVDFIETKSRNMAEYFLDCNTLRETSEVLEKLKEWNLEIKDNIVKFNFENMGQHLLLEFKDTEIWEFFKEAFHFEYRKIRKQDSESNLTWNFEETENFINDAFDDFWETVELDEALDKDKIKEELKLKIK